jgi:hypothetical protein
MSTLKCPKCGSPISVSASDAGQQVHCPACQATFRIKAKTSPAVPRPAPAPAAAAPVDDGYGLAPGDDLKPMPAPQMSIAPRVAVSTPSVTVSKPKAKREAALPGYVVPLAIGGVLVSFGMLAAIAFVAYSLLGGGGDNQVADQGGNNRANNVANNVANNSNQSGPGGAHPALVGGDWPIATAAARPAAADQSLPSSLELSAIDWRVTPDDGSIKPEELKPLTLMQPAMGPSVMLFQREEPGVVTLVGRVQHDQGWLTWATYDLRKGERLRSVELVTLAENDLSSAQPFFDVSPDGKSLLLAMVTCGSKYGMPLAKRSRSSGPPGPNARAGRGFSPTTGSPCSVIRSCTSARFPAARSSRKGLVLRGRFT